MIELAERPADVVVSGDGSPLALIDPQSGEFVLRSMEPAAVREYIRTLTRVLLAGEAREMETKHTFHAGIYMRELFIPKGTILVGKVHRVACINVVSKGDISILTETGSARVRAGYSVVSPAGLQKVGFAHADTVFVNVFRTDETDPERIEQAIAWEGEAPCLSCG